MSSWIREAVAAGKHIRRDALEDAEKACVRVATSHVAGISSPSTAAHECAEAIRALKEEK